MSQKRRYCEKSFHRGRRIARLMIRCQKQARLAHRGQEYCIHLTRRLVTIDTRNTTVGVIVNIGLLRLSRLGSVCFEFSQAATKGRRHDWRILAASRGVCVPEPIPSTRAQCIRRLRRIRVTGAVHVKAAVG